MGGGEKFAPPSLLTSRTREELGPLRPTPAHSQMSLRDGMDVRLRGGIRRAPEGGGGGEWKRFQMMFLRGTNKWIENASRGGFWV